MRVFAHFLVTLSLLLPLAGNGQVQCAVDVTINEGATIDMCQEALQTITASNGFAAYVWSGAGSGNTQTITPTTSGQYIISATDGVGCVSRDTIIVQVFPTPTDAIVSSAGNPFCVANGGTTLSLSGTYASYDWGNGVTTPTYDVSAGGSYNVTFIDNNGCTGNASIVLTEVTFGLTTSGTSICTGGSSTLTASGGTSYSWSTGESGSTIVVNPSTSTVYSVTISDGSCTQTLSTTITPVEVPPFDLPDTVYVGEGQSTFIAGPSGFVSYDWTPGNNLNDSTIQGVTFIGDSTQYITLVATHADGCDMTDGVLVIVVRLTIPNGFSPNDDGFNDYFVIPELNDYPGKVTVWNRWGDIVFESDRYRNDWDGRCKGPLCMGSEQLPEGTYFYLVDVQGITFKGYLTLKL